MKLWSGRFEKDPDKLVEELNASIGFDARMYREDITGSIAHAGMLGAQGIIDVEEAEKIVFFGGAGVSTESGIPDFRSADGLYHQKYKYNPETILSHSFFIQKPEEFYEFYRDKMIVTDVEPNITHQFLANLEVAGKLTAVITQNIDGLHQAGGSKNVIELHGSIHRNFCMKCKKRIHLKHIDLL